MSNGYRRHLLLFFVAKDDSFLNCKILSKIQEMFGSFIKWYKINNKFVVTGKAFPVTAHSIQVLITIIS
jgi:hypothetical protein